MLGGLVWAIEHPSAGIVEADELDHRRVLEVALAPIWVRSWAPTATGRRSIIGPGLFADSIDPTDPWQFKNVLVG